MAKPASGTALDTTHPLYSSIVAAYPVNEGSGATVHDMKGGHDATIAGSVSWGSDADGPLLTGAGGVLTLASPISIGTGDWTATFNATNSGGGNNGIPCGNNTTTNQFIWMHDGTTFSLQNPTQNANWTITSEAVASEYLLAFNAAGNIYKLFRDGVSQGTQPAGSSAAWTINTLMGGYSGNAVTQVGNLKNLVIYNADVSSSAVSLASSPYQIYSSTPAASATITEQNLPANHLGNLTVHAVGTSTAWTSSTTWTASGVAGWSVAGKTFVDGAHYTIALTPPTSATPPAGATGTLTLTEGVTGSVAATTTIGTPTLAISPTSGNTGTTPTLTLTGVKTLWISETASGLFTVSGGTGASIATPTVTTDTAATDVLTVGSAGGTLTITDHSTGATASFTANAPSAPTAGVLTFLDSTASGPRMSWTVGSGGTGSLAYDVHRSTVAGFTPITGTKIATGASSPYTDGTATAGITYYYAVQVRDTVPLTANTNEVIGTVWASKIVLGGIGHSLIAGAGAGAGNDPVTLCATSLAKSARERIVTVSNQAIGGTKLPDWGVGGTDYNAAVAALNSAGCTHLILMFGRNDTASAVTFGSQYAAIVAGLLADITGLQKVFIAWDIYASSQPTRNNLMTQYNAQVDAMDNGTTVRVIGRLAYAYFGERQDQLQGDGIHPNAVGQQAMGGVIWARDIGAVLDPAGGGSAVFAPIGCGFIRGG